MLKNLKILTTTSQNNCFQYKKSNAYRNYSDCTGQSGESKGHKTRNLQRLSGDSQGTNIKNYGL